MFSAAGKKKKKVFSLGIVNRALPPPGVPGKYLGSMWTHKIPIKPLLTEALAASPCLTPLDIPERAWAWGTV